MTRLGLVSNDAFYKYMEDGGFVQELPHDLGFLVPLHEYTFVLPYSEDKPIHKEVMYQLYVMFSCFVRSEMVLDNESYIAVSNFENTFVLRLMHYYDNEEDTRCFLKTHNYGDADYYPVDRMEEFDES